MYKESQRRKGPKVTSDPSTAKIFLLGVPAVAQVAAAVWVLSFLFFFLFFFFRAAPAAYGGSQVRGLIGAAAAGLPHSHSNVGSEPHLQPTPQLMPTLVP